ncbi:hypothetical protein [Streptomyces sp. NPDC048142]|uniref:hypothetical protein n=1 Tax=Streptomyces sp. NPDC048142 TaxID=3365501 RepID=UPI003714DD74
MTGLRYDRIESKFLAYDVRPGRSEAEVRLAAFRHSYGSSLKECVSATSTVRLTGNTSNVVSVSKWRWIHGIEFGWDYTDSDDAIYTIELQHRNPNDCLRKEDPARQVFGPYKDSDKSPPSGYGQLFYNNGERQGVWIWGNRMRYTSSNTWVDSGTPAPVAWNDLPGSWDGKYNLSQMHYCVGVPQDRAPGASENGWFWIVGGNAKIVRPPNINEPVFTV